jgi:hypothetical protein
MKRRLDVASKASWFKSLRNGGAGQEEKIQVWLSRGLRVLERQPVVITRVKVYPDEMTCPNISPAKPAAESLQTEIEISEDAAISRLRPIQDGLDDWQEHRSSANTGSGGSAPG